MNRIIPTPNFEKGYKKIVKKYPAFKQDMATLLTSLAENAAQGVETQPNVRKIRLAISGKSKGKSGGARVIIYVRIEKEEIRLLYVYDKAEIADIPPHEINSFLKELLLEFEEEEKKE